VVEGSGWTVEANFPRCCDVQMRPAWLSLSEEIR
jgi:hypothetical protein